MNLQLQDFEGPFDLLLHLVRISKMDIYKVNIRDIINQYIDFINLNKDDLDKNSEYLVLSSELIHLKSRMLINKYEEDEDEDDSEFNIKSEEDLRNKLLNYEKYKNITDTFRQFEENRLDYYTKIPSNLNEYVEDNHIVNSDVSLDDLLQAFLDMQKRINFERPINTKITNKEYSIKDRIKEIRNILKIKKRVEFTELFDIITKENLVVTFISILDMSKKEEITLKQDKIFSTIIIESVVK